jgi:hypothetical protein
MINDINFLLPFYIDHPDQTRNLNKKPDWSKIDTDGGNL